MTRNWNFIQNQPLLAKIFKKPPLISSKRGKSLKDMLVKAKLWIEGFHQLSFLQSRDRPYDTLKIEDARIIIKDCLL